MKHRWMLFAVLLFSLCGLGALPPTQGGVLTLRSPLPLHNVDPLFARTPQEWTLSRQMYEPLFVETQAGFESRVLHHWRLEDEGRRLHLWLKAKVRFHDGSLLRAEDIKATLVRALTLGRHSAEAALLDSLRGARALRLSQNTELSGVQVDNPQELTLWLDHPDTKLFKSLSHPRFALVPARARLHAEKTKPPVGNGPFMLREQSGTRWRWVAFDQAVSGRPLFDRLEVVQGKAPRVDAAWSEQTTGPLTDEMVLRAMNPSGRAYMALIRHQVQCNKALALFAPKAAKADPQACEAFSFKRERVLASLPAAQQAGALQLHVSLEDDSLLLWARRLVAELAPLGLSVHVQAPTPSVSQDDAIVRLERRLVGFPYPEDKSTLRLFGEAVQCEPVTTSKVVRPQADWQREDLAWWWRRLDATTN